MTFINKSKVNPNVPVFLLKIGDTDFTLQNSVEQAEYVVSFSMNRNYEDVANDIKISLFDDTALVIEYYIAKGFKKVQFQYGMDETNLSKLFTAHIKDYEIEFTGSGRMLLSLDLQLGSLESTDSLANEESKVYQSNSPSAVVKQIASECGWKIGKIVDTARVPHIDAFIKEGKTPQDFIKDELIPNSVSTDGRTNYTFYIDFNNKGEEEVYFLPKDTQVDTSDIKTYEIVIGGGGATQDDSDPEVVISFTPSYNGVLQHVLTNSSDILNSSSDSEPSISNVEIDIPGIDSLTNSIVSPYTGDGITRRVGSSTYSDTQAGKIAEYLWTRMASLDNQAQLVLRGDASFYAQAYVVLVVLTPDGFFHHSSGLYQILDISDDIEGGLYTTTLNMVKRPMVVAPDGSISVGEPVSYQYTDNNSDTGSSNSLSSVGSSVEETRLREICNSYNGCQYSQKSRTGTASYDCSSLVNVILGDMGIKVPWGTTGQGIGFKNSWGTTIWESGKGTLTSDMIKPGYVGLYNNDGSGHTWLFVNNSTIFHASSPSRGVLYDPIDWYIKEMNKKPSGRAVVWAPPTSSGTPLKNNGIKSRVNKNL